LKSERESKTHDNCCFRHKELKVNTTTATTTTTSAIKTNYFLESLRKISLTFGQTNNNNCQELQQKPKCESESEREREKRKLFDSESEK